MDKYKHKRWQDVYFQFSCSGRHLFSEMNMVLVSIMIIDILYTKNTSKLILLSAHPFSHKKWYIQSEPEQFSEVLHYKCLKSLMSTYILSGAKLRNYFTCNSAQKGQQKQLKDFYIPGLWLRVCKTCLQFSEHRQKNFLCL